VKFADTQGAEENPDADSHPANPNRKESCWNCYKLFSMAEIQAKTDSVTNKIFCSDATLQKHLMSSQIPC